MIRLKNYTKQLPKVDLEKAGSYLSNLAGKYGEYKQDQKARRKEFRDKVQAGADNLYQQFPDGVQKAIDKAGSYVQNLTGVGNVGDYLKKVDYLFQMEVYGMILFLCLLNIFYSHLILDLVLKCFLLPYHIHYVLYKIQMDHK